MDMSRVSTCTYPLRECDLDTTFDVIAQAGFTKLDLWGRKPHFSVLAEEVRPEDIEAAARKYGLRIANLGTYPGADFAAPEAETRQRAMEEMIATIDLAVRFGARSIRIMPGKSDDPAGIPALVEPFRRSADYAARRGIYLGMENHGGSLAGNPATAAELCQAVGSPHFGVLYEPCNLMHAHVDYQAAFAAFSPWIVHTHFKDGAWVGERFDRRHLGEGDIDFPWVIQALASIGYEGDFALEYEICDIEPIATGLPKWLAYAKTL